MTVQLILSMHLTNILWAYKTSARELTIFSQYSLVYDVDVIPLV